jgi:hypothetical protein
VQNRKALASQLERLADTPGLCRLIVGHGKVVDNDPAAQLRKVSAQLSR